MTWGVLILLAASLSAEAYSFHHDFSERLVHGRQLKISLHENTDKIEFIPAYDLTNKVVYWEKYKHRPLKGRVSGTGSSRRWYIDKVTYDDEGKYLLKDHWNRELATVMVTVTPKRNYVRHVAGESLYISLEGVDPADAILSFSGPAANITLVHDGAPVAQDHPDYWNRVQTHSTNIEIRHVNTSDEGHYTLKDRKDRVVSVTRMDLTDHHEYSSKNPLMALLLLLGIPAGICCCCRKKIFKKKGATTKTLQTSAEMVHTPPAGPVGPCPPYNGSGQPGEVHYYGPNANMGPTVHPPPPGAGLMPVNGPPPSPGFNPAYPPQNPSYPPPGSAPDPQWGYPPPNQYPPAPVAPMAYAPAAVMYSSPPPAAEPVNDANVEKVASPADPLLTAAPQGEAVAAPVPPSSTNVPTSSDGAAKFQIDAAKDSVNFL